MPGKGGRVDLSDQEIIKAVEYIVEQVASEKKTKRSYRDAIDTLIGKAANAKAPGLRRGLTYIQRAEFTC